MCVCVCVCVSVCVCVCVYVYVSVLRWYNDEYEIIILEVYFKITYCDIAMSLKNVMSSKTRWSDVDKLILRKVKC